MRKLDSFMKESSRFNGINMREWYYIFMINLLSPLIYLPLSLTKCSDVLSQSTYRIHVIKWDDPSRWLDRISELGRCSLQRKELPECADLWWVSLLSRRWRFWSTCWYKRKELYGYDFFVVLAFWAWSTCLVTSPFPTRCDELILIRKPQLFAFSPGRFFAVNEMKVMMAYLVLHFDVKSEQNKLRPANQMIGTVIAPSQDGRVLFRQRSKDKTP